MPKIYLDYAATTPIDSKILKAMGPYLRKEFGNASSIHTFGQKALAAVDQSRQIAADFLNCKTEEIIFTGSATEANNLAIFSSIGERFFKKEAFSPHIITTQIEHHAVFEPCKELEKRGAQVTYLPINKNGLVSVSDVDKAIKSNTVLVSIMYANNEIGTVQPIQEIGKLVKDHKILFHTDAVQAANYLDCDVEKLGVDLLTLSSHKIYGPKGVGLLYVRKGTNLNPLIFGGGQEHGLRSGTENVAGIVGFSQALKELQNPKSKIQNIRIRQFRDKITKYILKFIPDCRLNGSQVNRLPNNVNISFRGAEGEAVVISLDQKGIACSTGSACSSRSLEPSHVLLALGLSDEEAHGSLRISLGKYTTAQEIDKFLKVLPSVVEKLRKISGYK